MNEDRADTKSELVDLDLRFKYDSSDPAVGADPVPYYKALLATPPTMVERRGVQWAIVSRYQDCVAVLRDFKRFSSVNPNLPGTEDFDAFKGVPVMTFVDPPTHTRLRRVAAPSLAVRRMNDMEPQFRAICGRILDSWAGRSVVDIVSSLAVELPVRVFGYLLDIPEKDYEVVRSVGAPGKTLYSEDYLASRHAYITELVARRRRQSGGQDLISLAIAAHEASEKINELELFGMVMVLVTGGISTTADSISGAIYQMISRPQLLDRIRVNPSLVPHLVEENLRYDGPVQTLFRVTTEDVEVAGMPIKGRTPVYVVTGAANRDPAVFKDPDTFDITRDPNDHLGLGEGIHFCIGAAPARMQGKVAVQMLLERFPRLRIAEGWKPQYAVQAFGRGLVDLPLRLD
ncbi:MAG: cytochrome P450 [Candidatus Binataceae bacterium]